MRLSCPQSAASESFARQLKDTSFALGNIRSQRRLFVSISYTRKAMKALSQLAQRIWRHVKRSSGSRLLQQSQHEPLSASLGTCNRNVNSHKAFQHWGTPSSFKRSEWVRYSCKKLESEYMDQLFEDLPHHITFCCGDNIVRSGVCEVHWNPLMASTIVGLWLEPISESSETNDIPGVPGWYRLCAFLPWELSKYGLLRNYPLSVKTHKVYDRHSMKNQGMNWDFDDEHFLDCDLNRESSTLWKSHDCAMEGEQGFRDRDSHNETEKTMERMFHG